jgi:NAD+ kinase
MNADKNIPFEHVAVLAHTGNQAAEAETPAVLSFFTQRGVQATRGDLNDAAIRERVRAGDFDLVVTLGGDGTVLRAGHLCAAHDVPLLAINMGRFGFLIEVEADRWQELLPNLFTENYWYEQRMLISVELQRGNQVLGSWEALNEAMVGRGQVVRPVHLSAMLDGHQLTTYVADGLIIATPTGSTAYALAAGGPILPPDLRNLLLVPVAPHLSVDRAIVLAEGAVIRVQVELGEEAVLSIDGQQSIPLEVGDVVQVHASEHSVRFLRFQERGYFYQRLLSIMDNNPSAETSDA